MEESLDKKKEIMQWMLRWESNPGDIEAAQNILEGFKNYAPAIDVIYEISEYFLKNDIIPVSLLYELHTFHTERNDQQILQQVSSRWKTIKIETEQDYFSYLHYLRDVQELEKALTVIDDAKQKGFDTDRFFLIHLELLIDQRDFNQALTLLSVQRCKDLCDPECYLIRAKLLSHSSPRTSSLRDEVEYLCLEALRLDAQKMDAFMLLLEWYAMVFRSAGKIMFLFKLAQSYGIQELLFYREVLSALLLINEAEEASPVYEALQKLLPLPDQTILDFVKFLHIDLNCLGYARSIWRSYRQRGAIDNELFYQNILRTCKLLKQFQSALPNVDCERNEDDWDSALRQQNDQLYQIIDQTVLFCYDQLIQIDPENSLHYYHKGCMFKKSKPQNAIMLFRKALDISPEHLLAKLELAKTYESEGAFLKASESYIELLRSPKIDSEQAMEAYLHLSDIALDFSWKEQAAFYLKQAQNIVIKDFRSHLALSRLYFKEYCLSGCEQALEQSHRQAKQVLAMAEANSEALSLLSRMAFARKKYFLCIKYCADALKNGTSQKEASLFLRISRSYYELFLDKPLSSKDYLKEAIHYAQKIVVEEALQSYIHHYLHKLHREAGLEYQVKHTVPDGRQKAASIPAKVGTLKVLSITSSPDYEKTETENMIFSEGHFSEIQCCLVEGSEQFHITGNNDNLLHSQAQLAYGFTRQVLARIKSREVITRKDLLLDLSDWHLGKHHSSGAVAIAIAMISACLDQPLPQDLMIFGEMTLSGNLLPVQGLKEFIELAHEKKITKLYVSSDNQLDYVDILLENTKFPKIASIRFVSSATDLLGEFFKIDEK